MAIACVYCGGEHATPADVRACWQRSEAQSAAPAAPERVMAAVPERAAEPVVRFARPGPEELARGVVVRAGDPPPAAWSDAERVVIDANVLNSPEATVADLWLHAVAGRRVVVELAVPFHEMPGSSTSDAPYEVGARFWFPLEVLHHLVWRNAIDATAADPHWPLLDHAVALGARVVVDGVGDIRLADGRVVWLDGGATQRRDPLDGLAVLHAVAVEHGSLNPPLDDGEAPAPAAQLAPDQRAAVMHRGGSARIIAPAGSGKTRVLTERARHLLNDWRLPASAISLVAFNKRAQEEMRSRTPDLRGLQVRTLNAIALAIVNGSAPFRPQSRQVRTIDEIDVRRIIGRLVQFPRKRNTDPVAAWMEALSMVRLGLRSPDEVEAMYNGDVDGLADVWPQYRAALQREGVVDFDDQIYRAIELLLTDPETRHAAQRACRVMLVDEFQDLTPAHVLLVRLLCAPGFSVFGVGDDDQTIYGYSGADPAWLIDFATLFPDAGAHPLEVNYRCPGDVVLAADRLVRHNRRRVAKVIRSADPDRAGLRVDASPDTLRASIGAVTAALAAGRRPSDIAVLARVNALLAPVQVGLRAAGISVQGGVGAEFTERTAVRAALAWLRLSVARPDSLQPGDLAEALRRPSRPMHPNVANWVGEQSSLAGLRRLAGRVNNERDAGRIASFADDIVALQRLAETATTADVIAVLAEDIGLGAAIASLDDGRHGMNRAAQNDDLEALAQLATLQPDPALFGSWLREHLAMPRSGDGVTLATVHRVKGQEWPLVVVHHAAADQFPHRLAEDHEEERRVFHVAITRGAEDVVVVAPVRQPSPFIEEMRNEPPERSPEPVLTPTHREMSRPKPEAAPRDSPFEKGTVLAAPGLVLVDGGQEWIVESVDADGAMARLGTVTRRFKTGSAVATPGRQRGPLRVREVDSATPSDASVRAHDLLRQTRERLRSGKPAYVVFDDKTLEKIALTLPTSLRTLGGVPGIGPAKLEQYGDAILVAIEDATTAGGA